VFLWRTAIRGDRLKLGAGLLPPEPTNEDKQDLAGNSGKKHPSHRALGSPPTKWEDLGMSWKYKFEEQVNRLGIWATAIGALWGVMTWVASYFTPLAPYGWGAFVFVGLGAACILSLVISAALASWRFFNPLDKDRSSDKPAAKGDLSQMTGRIDAVETQVTKARADQTDVNRSLDGMIGRLDDKIDKTAKELETRATALVQSFRELKDQVDHQYELTCRGQLRLAQALRARDAEVIIKEADTIVSNVGARLINAHPSVYADQRHWMPDYERWYQAMSRIDTVYAQWQPSHGPFLDIRRTDYEQFHKKAPEHIRSDKTAMQYKTLCLAQLRYGKERKDIFSYFHAKSNDIP
jgi:hypothetical protein